MKYANRIRIITIVSLMTMLMSGCSLLDWSSGSQSIDPPPQENTGLEAEQTSNSASEQSGSMQVTLYFKDGNGFVAPITMNVPKTESAAMQSLQWMVEDSSMKERIPQGFTALIPKGTVVKGIGYDKEKKLATVDFSKEFLNYNPQDERKILEAITWTLTGFPSFSQVQLRVEGKDLKEMPMAATPLDEPLSRKMGINIERSDGVDFGQSTPVTLYFQGQTADNMKYFVPVTRMVKRTDDLAKATLEQLIQGPEKRTSLATSISPGTEILNIEAKEDVITVNLSDKWLSEDKKVPADALQSMVLSLTENSQATQVQIMVQGSTKLSTADQQMLAKPVTRPTYINPSKM